MISIFKATEHDYKVIVDIGNISVPEAHKGSCAPADLDEYIQANYNESAVKKELAEAENIYHIINFKDKAVGFSKIVLNAKHPNIDLENIVKLDKMYLLKEFQEIKLGYELLNFNIKFAKDQKQSAIWLYTWVGNLKAIHFYAKNGFNIIGQDKFYINKTTSNEIHQMLLSLDD